jgi:glutamate-1-semialdehyde aminotransferase
MHVTKGHDDRSASARLFERARKVIPGGTSKANMRIRPHPCYVASGAGCRVTDVNGIGRLDALNNFTALIHGHGFRPIVEAVTRQVARGSAFASKAARTYTGRDRNRLGCLSTPMTEREVEEIAVVLDRALHALR